MSKAKRTRGAAAAPKAAPASAESVQAEGVAWAALLTAVVVVPLANAVFTMPFTGRTIVYDMYDLPKMFVLRSALLAALAALVWHVLARDGRVRRSPLLAGVAVVLGWLGIATVFSVDPLLSVFGQYQRAEGLLTFLTYALTLFLAVQLTTTGSRVRELASALASVSVPIGVYGVSQYLGYDPIPWQGLSFAGRAFSTYGNPEPLGNFLMFALPLSVALALGEKRPARRATWWAVSLLDLVTLVVTFTRGAWIGGLVGLAVLAALSWRQGVRLVKKVDGWFAAAAAAVLVLLTAASGLRADTVTRIPERLLSLISVEPGSGQTRLELWTSAAHATAARPVAGFGPDTFALLFPAFRTKGFFAVAGYMASADNAHDLALQLASTIGVVGALLVAGLIGWALFMSRRALLDRSAPPSQARIVAAGFAAAVIGYLANLVVGVAEPGTMFMLWLALGVLVAPTAVAWSPPAGAWRRPTAIAAIALIAVAFLGGLVAVRADAAYLEATKIEVGSARLDAADEAVRLAPGINVYREFRSRAHTEYALSIMRAARDASTPITPEMRDDYAAGIALVKECLRVSRWSYESFKALARYENDVADVLMDGDHSVAAERAATEGLDRFPDSPMLFYERARARFDLGDMKGAERDARASLAIEPRHANSALLLARILAEGGDVAAALTLLRDTERITPDRAVVATAIRRLEASGTAAP